MMHRLTLTLQINVSTGEIMDRRLRKGAAKVIEALTLKKSSDKNVYDKRQRNKTTRESSPDGWRHWSLSANGRQQHKVQKEMRLTASKKNMMHRLMLILQSYVSIRKIMDRRHRESAAKLIKTVTLQNESDNYAYDKFPYFRRHERATSKRLP